MKKMSILLLAALLMLWGTSCGSGSQGNNATEPPTESAPAPSASPEPREGTETVAVNDADTANTGSSAEAVDLGLSVKWASFNVGAEKPEDYGTYFGWGDVTGEKTSTDNDDYPSADPPANISGTGHDAAHILWGGSWRMPTREEQEELVNGCGWESTELNGIAGYQVTGPNGNGIFLAASGGRDGTEVHYQVSGGDFWSGTLSGNTDEAYYMWFYGGRQDVEDLPRHMGFAIRPVTE